MAHLQNVFGEEICEFHFKESVDRPSKKFRGTQTSTFKDLAVQLLECVTPERKQNIKA
jgi:hypothetical protein